MKKTIIAILSAFTSIAYAEPSTYRSACIDALAEMEFGEKRPSNYEIEGRVKEGGFIWSGEKIYRRVARMKKENYKKPLKTDGTVVWDAEQFRKDGDGRVASPESGEKISPAELKAVQSAFIVESFPHLITVAKRSATLVDKIYGACEGVDDVKMPNGKSVAEVSLARRAGIRKSRPDLFPAGAESTTKSGHR